MKIKLNRLLRRYLAALRIHLTKGTQASLDSARGLGRRAVVLGLDTLGLARIHEQALVSLNGYGSGRVRPKRVEDFFDTANAPILAAHRVGQATQVHFNRQKNTSGQHTVSMAASHRCLKQGIIQRKAAEKALKKSGEHFTRLLVEARRLQNHLRHQTRRILSKQEEERRTISQELHNEIAQTLLGINVRLLTLKTAGAVGAQGLKKEIASTQRLVEESVRSIDRFTRELDIHHRA